MRKSIRERFNNWVDIKSKDECWEYKRAIHKNGYVYLSIRHQPIVQGDKKGNRVEYLHRISWWLHYGKIPKGLLVCHKCDNRKCANPCHLFLGTSSDNIKDAYNKGRIKIPDCRGEKCGTSILKNEQIKKIRKFYKTGKYLQKDLAKMYKISKPHISDIINRKRWKHI